MVSKTSMVVGHLLGIAVTIGVRQPEGLIGVSLQMAAPAAAAAATAHIIQLLVHTSSDPAAVRAL
jgi:hypothetical protein